MSKQQNTTIEPSRRPKDKGGRPTLYSDDLAAQICSQMAMGYSLRKICSQDDMPALSSVFLWLSKYKEFSEQYAKAREQQAEAMFEEMLEIADDNHQDKYVDDNGVEKTNTEVVARSRLRVDTRKWALSKMLPKRYGDKVQQEVSGPDGKPLETVNYNVDMSPEDAYRKMIDGS